MSTNEPTKTDERTERERYTGDNERTEPFWRIKPHRSVIRDIDQMRDNLDDLESIVREAEWVELGGRGCVEVERAAKICEAVEGSMPYILDYIRELPAPKSTDTEHTEDVE